MKYHKAKLHTTMFPSEEFKDEFISTILWNPQQEVYQITPDDPLYQSTCSYQITLDRIEYWVTLNGPERIHKLIGKDGITTSSL